MNIPIHSATSIAINSAINSTVVLNSNMVTRHGDIVFHGPMALVLTITAMIIFAILFVLVITTLVGIIKETW